MTVDVDIGLLKQAYETLSLPASRAVYDATRTHAAAQRKTGPRPAQVVSLEEFDEVDGDETRWTYPCRCGGTYAIAVPDMEAERHLVGCSSCSEVVWVGYELVEE